MFFFLLLLLFFFIKLRVLVGRKKSIRGSDVICLTFSSLGVMNGKVRKQMTKVCRWQTNVCHQAKYVLRFAERSLRSNAVQNTKWTNKSSWMGRIWQVRVRMSCRKKKKCLSRPHRGNGKNSRGGYFSFTDISGFESQN